MRPEGVLQSLLFHRASRGLRAQRATFRVLAEGDPDVDAALASAVGCSPPPRSLTPPRPPLSDQRSQAATLPRLSDSDSAIAGGVAAALMLASSELLASTGRAELGPERSGASSGALSAREGGLNRAASRDPLSKSSGRPVRLAAAERSCAHSREAGRLPTPRQRATAEKPVSLAGGESRDWSLRRGPALLPRRHGYPAGRLMGDSRRSRSWTYRPSGRPASARDKACSAATGIAERESSEWRKGSSARPRLPRGSSLRRDSAKPAVRGEAARRIRRRPRLPLGRQAAARGVWEIRCHRGPLSAAVRGAGGRGSGGGRPGGSPTGGPSRADSGCRVGGGAGRRRVR